MSRKSVGKAVRTSDIHFRVSAEERAKFQAVAAHLHRTEADAARLLLAAAHDQMVASRKGGEDEP